MSRYFALVPAAGVGTRLGSALPKQYLRVGQQSMLWHAVHALCLHPDIDRVVVALSPDDRWFSAQSWNGFGRKLHALRCGGRTRAHTVRNALGELRAELSAQDWVLVHDAARPCLTAQLIDALIAAVGEDQIGGLLALAVADTLKRADGQGRVDRTEPRDGLWAAQTPQMFRYGVLVRALEAAGDTVTDEAGAIEQLGLRPLLVCGSTSNLKVTVAEDVSLAAAILEAGKRGAPT